MAREQQAFTQSPQQPPHRKAAAIHGKDRHQAQAQGQQKGKSKRGRGHKPSQEHHLQSMLLQQSQSPAKKRNRGGGHGNHSYEQSFAVQAAAQQHVAQQAAGLGQSGGGHGRRKLAPEASIQSSVQLSSAKASQQRLHAGAASHGPPAKYPVANQHQSQSQRKPGIGAHGMLSLPPGGQAYAYAAQIKEAAERGVAVGMHGKGGAKHHGHRKHQPVAIDTFNIVSNRRTSLIKQVGDASAARAAHSMKTANQSFYKHSVQTRSPDNPSNKQNTELDTQAQATSPGGPDIGGGEAEALTVGLSLQSSVGGLVLPDIMSQSKSGMSHATHTTGHNPNMTPNQQTTGPQYQHRGSNSFSGVSGKHVLASTGGQDITQNKVLSEKGDGQGRRAGGAHAHARTQQSAELQAQIQGKLYPPPMASSHAANDYSSIAHSVDTKGNAAGRAGGGSGPRGVDVKRRTTGSLFQMPNAQTVSSLAQSHLSGSHPQQKQAVLSPQGQSLASNGKVNRRIQNIVSPIQDGTPASVARTVSDNLMQAPPTDSPQAALRQAERRRATGDAGATKASALERNALHQSVYEDSRPVYPMMHSEQQSIIENSLFYDSVMPQIDPRSHGSGSRGGTGKDPANTAAGPHAILGSRLNPEVTLREATECSQRRGAHGGRKGGLEGTAAKRAAIAQGVKEDSAECRVDTDLSQRAYLAASQGDDSAYDKAALRQIGRQARRAEETRTQFGPDGSTPLRQQNIQLPARVIHSNQDHKNQHAHMAQSQERFNNRQGESYLRQNESMAPSQESVTSDEDEEDEEDDDDMSMPKPSTNSTIQQNTMTAGRRTMYPQSQDHGEPHVTPPGKHKRRQYGMDQPSQTQYGFAPHHGTSGSHVQQMQSTAGGHKEKRRGKKHRRQNTHHHYHIDFNFEQVNNILVSYGGLGLQQQLKHQVKKDAGKANVSMSMGAVHGQFSQNQNPKGTSSSMPSHGGGGPTGGAAGGPSKRGQVQANGILLPELIINKNKINFGSKQYKMHADDHRVSTRQLKEAAQNVASYNLAQQAASTSNRNPAAHGAQKTRRKKQKKDAQQSMPFDDLQYTSAAGRRNVAEKYRTPKRHQMSQSLNPGAMSQHMHQYQSTEGRPQNIARLDANIAGRAPQDSIRVLRQSQVNMHARPHHEAEAGRIDQVDVPNRQGYRGVLSRASNHSKESRPSAGDDSPDQGRERPAQQALTDQHVRRSSQLTSSALRRGEQQWQPTRKTREKGSIDEQASDFKQVMIGNNQGAKTSGSSVGGAASKGAVQASTPGFVPSKIGGASQPSAPGAIALRARQKQPLHVITKGPGAHGQSGVIETPKRFFTVKAHNRGGSRAKIGAFEQHSAGLRPGQRNVEAEEGSQTGAGQGTAGPRGTYHTLSQISSVLSASVDQDAARRGSATGSRQAGAGQSLYGTQPGSAQPHRGTGFLPPRTQKVKTILREQEKKLKQIDAQNRRTHQLLEQFNNGSQARTVEPQADGTDASEAFGSPSRPVEQRRAKPKISDFELEGVVGIGNFGKVHKAYNKRENRVCALKVLKKESVAQMKHVDHIINELEVLQYLSERDRQAQQEWALRPHDKEDEDEEEEEYVAECPFLMGLYSTFQDKENLYFELEYIQGCTLLSQIRLYNQQVQKNMTFYATEVLLTLSYLHSHSIIYRDLKPENIVISMTERGHIKLVDFGFAKRLPTLSQRTYTNCGTPAYIAPEVLIDSKGHGHEVDVWGLGILMCEIISGQTPFHAESTLEVYENINKCQPVYNKLITQALRDLLGKVFVKDPEVRLTLEQMKMHKVFAEQDWDIPVETLYWCGSGPFVPAEAMFNEKADRESEKVEPAKPKNILAAIMGKPLAEDNTEKPQPQKDLNFDQCHYSKFERANEGQGDNSPTKRKRQNPLGDFKFVKINELF